MKKMWNTAGNVIRSIFEPASVAKRAQQVVHAWNHFFFIHNFEWIPFNKFMALIGFSLSLTHTFVCNGTMLWFAPRYVMRGWWDYLKWAYNMMRASG
jgi:hypothetical protein